jgi:competence protein ComEC
LTYPTAGTTLDLGYGVRLQTLHPGEALPQGTASDSNNNGLVLRLSWGKASFLLAGDLGADGEAYLLAQEGLPLNSTVLKVAHHGAGGRGRPCASCRR